MKKIMFNDRYGLTKAVIGGRKTMTRRIIPDIIIDWVRRGKVKATIEKLDHQVLMMGFPEILGGDLLYSADRKYQPKYYIGDIVAVAQPYKDIYPNADFEMVGDVFMTESPGWTNKMFVRADLMPHQVRITNIKLERLRDISGDDILREGIIQSVDAFDMYTFDGWFCNDGSTMPIHRYAKDRKDAFHSLINRICGVGTWERNPWCYAYEFELIK